MYLSITLTFISDLTVLGTPDTTVWPKVTELPDWRVSY